MVIDTNDIYERILEVLETDLDWPVDRATVARDTRLGAEGLGLESLSVFEVVVCLENEFSITISDEAIEALGDATVGGLTDQVARCLAAQRTSA